MDDSAHLKSFKLIFMAKHVRAIFPVLLLLLSGGLQAQYYVGSGALFFISASSPFYVNGDVILASGSTTVNNGTLQLTGSLASDGTATMSSGTVNFSGSAAQTFSGNALTVGTLVASNTSGGITLSAPITVGAATTFTSGLVATDATNLLIYANGASPGTPTDASHVDGPTQYLGTGAFTYPVGNATYYRNIDVNLSANGAGLTATYTQGDGVTTNPGNTTYQSPLAGVSKMEYWTLTPVSTATATVMLNWDAARVSPGINNTAGLTALRVAHFDGTQWLNEGGSYSGTTTSGTITSGTISSWSPFALGTTDIISAPLPLQFLGINASLNSDGSRFVNWTVTQEFKVANYTVQRSSAGGGSFTDIASLAATGSQSRQTYSYTDAAVLNNSVVYYRIAAIDMDGRKTYSNIVAVPLQTAQGIKLQPNPVSTQLNISFGASMAGNYSLQIVNTAGALMYQQEIAAAANSTIAINRPSNITPGLYLVKLIRSNDNLTNAFKLLFK